MLDKFGEEIHDILRRCEDIIEELDLDYIGSESLLLALFEYPNSICRFLLREYSITSNEIKEVISKCLFLRKYEIVNNRYTEKFLNIINLSEELRQESDSKLIGDEHLFLSILKTKHTTARKILEILGLNITDLQNDYFNIFDESNSPNEEHDFLINISKQARQNKLNPFIGREKYLDRLEKILSKRQKNNPLLIGSAGVGKSAIVEGLTKRFVETRPHINVYYLDLGSLIAGTKYRGDLEQRISDALHSFDHTNDILFIDEIHNILGAGSSEGSLDIANILKPILSRSNIKCIGATTLDEYFKYFEKDKALARRFQNVYIEEPSNEETLSILYGIKPTYENYHEVQIDDKLLEYIIDSSKIIHTRKQPDKVIDILDEASYLAKVNNDGILSHPIIDEVIFSFLGLDYQNALSNIKDTLHFNSLKKYYLRYLMNINLKKTILNIECFNHETKDLIIDDLKQIFGLKDEVIFNLNLSEYQESHSIAMLLGAPPGYVGYDNGGEFSKHLLKFPISVVVITNYQLAHEKVKKVIENILKDGRIQDYQGRDVVFTNTFFIFINNSSEKNIIGFNNKPKKKYEKIIDGIDEVINFDVRKVSKSQLNCFHKYLTKFTALGYKIDNQVGDTVDNPTFCFEEIIAEIFQKNPQEEIAVSFCREQNKFII